MIQDLRVPLVLVVVTLLLDEFPYVEKISEAPLRIVINHLHSLYGNDY